MAKNRFVIPVAVAVIIASGVIAEEIGLFSSEVTNVSETGGSDESALIRAAAECEMYAYEQAGIPVSADDPKRKKYSIVKSTGIGTAAGAGVGAVGGEVTAGKSGKGAVVGAIVGGAAGFLKSRSDKKKYEKEVVKQAAQLEAFEKASRTCMTAKGY